MRAEVAKFSAQNRVPEGVAGKMVLCMDEAAANIVEHARGPSANDPSLFKVKVAVQGSMLKVTLCDGGYPYDPTRRPDVDVRKHVKSGKKDGLGVYILRRLLDIFEYNYVAGENVCTLGIRVQN